jgi:hypothetical protein
MPLTSIVVAQSDGQGAGDDFFMDGLFTTPAGKVGTPLRTQTGAHDFVKLDAAGNPEWHTRQVVTKPPGNDNSNPVMVTLQRVVTLAGVAPKTMPKPGAARKSPRTSKKPKPKQTAKPRRAKSGSATTRKSARRGQGKKR